MPVIIDLTAPLACFRIPLHHNYHRSFPLPPPTTVLGMLGAAMGLDEAGIDRWLRLTRPKLGIGGKHNGGGKELMTVRKVSAGGKIKAGEFSTILLRELRVDLTCRIVVQCAMAEQDQALCEAVNAPRYPISAGPADLLATMRAGLVAQLPLQPSNRLHHCLAPGSLWGKAKIEAEALKNTSLLETVAGPNSWNLPLAWQIGKKGERLPAVFAPFTFLTTGVKLQEPIPCVQTTLGPSGETLALPWLGPFDKWLIA
ncbi:MAG: CRISPR-associated protein Cas5 [candidate division KSB1 bacterium]|nr:CRISPR-associated protein Cas5 [candidate division KSB1 bacterium]MDZ7274614.1 CRISPR-associated protein Cas5 [candidate division KSB1 bacterium]MDZ7285439.1 CRISPR-associated protein Cas5 [candidate division KSB1 bacterium]MDZ7298471.1 CRISPR-associated protein Cas5 [candidate division KSB1 bacterium]MDZ7306955.1 CRISPR-associated protein Cas5 [candidate division KSB1 bacterium]